MAKRLAFGRRAHCEAGSYSSVPASTVRFRRWRPNPHGATRPLGAPGVIVLHVNNGAEAEAGCGVPARYAWRSGAIYSGKNITLARYFLQIESSSYPYDPHAALRWNGNS
jgi:hypothetical protein